MRKLAKNIDENGKISFREIRKLKVALLKNGDYIFKDSSENKVIPTDEELKYFNESLQGNIKVENGWLTFIGILTLINLIVEIIFFAQKN
jgi:hypothetical protein